MIQTPFPELKPFETPPRLPSLQNLLAAIPPHTPAPKPSATVSPQKEFPSFPIQTDVPVNPPKKRKLKNPIPLQPDSLSSSKKLQARVTPPPMPTAVASVVASAMEDEDDTPTATDDDLRLAFEPLVENSFERVIFAPDKGLHSYLEPMLRSTVRRAIAEQIDASVQFRATGTMDRLGWRLKALMTSRSYDEVVFHSTRRYQVEEAFLLRKEDFSLVSFASHDPARHASEKRIANTVRKLIRKLNDSEDSLQRTFDFGDEQTALIRHGDFTILVALVRGQSNSLVRADLDFVLRQAEDRFGRRLEEETGNFLHVLQPILEGCLLIQSPAPPN